MILNYRINKENFKAIFCNDKESPDIFKAKIQVKYKPKIQIEEGLRRFINWSDNVYLGIQQNES